LLGVVEQVEAERPDVGPPAVLRLDPRPQLGGEGGQVEGEVGGRLEHRRQAVDLGPRLDEVLGVELVAAVVALVAPGAVEPADRAGALDVAVGQRAAVAGRESGQLLDLDDAALGEDAPEQLAHHLVVVGGGGPGEQVVGQAQAPQVLDDQGVVAVGQLLRGQPLLVGGDRDRRAVLVGARDHQHVVTRQAGPARPDVARQAETGHVTDVARAVGIGPRGSGEERC
jgi:hypothetical protein